jgi:hypothetical protein
MAPPNSPWVYEQTPLVSQPGYLLGEGAKKSPFMLRIFASFFFSFFFKKKTNRQGASTGAQKYANVVKFTKYNVF